MSTLIHYYLQTVNCLILVTFLIVYLIEVNQIKQIERFAQNAVNGIQTHAFHVHRVEDKKVTQEILTQRMT